MLKIKLFRIGKKHQPVFRVIVTNKKNPPQGGRFLEILGFWNPLTKEKNLKPERIKYWLSVGAKPSDTVHNLLVSEKIIEGEKISVHKKKKGEIEEKGSYEKSSLATAENEKESKEKISQEKQTISEEAELKELTEKESKKEELKKEETKQTNP